MYSNCVCSCSFESEIMKISQSFYKIYSNNIVNYQESTTMLNARTKMSGNLLNALRIYVCLSVSVGKHVYPINVCVYVYVFECRSLYLGGMLKSSQCNKLENPLD